MCKPGSNLNIFYHFTSAMYVSDAVLYDTLRSFTWFLRELIDWCLVYGVPHSFLYVLSRSPPLSALTAYHKPPLNPRLIERERERKRFPFHTETTIGDCGGAQFWTWGGKERGSYYLFIVIREAKVIDKGMINKMLMALKFGQKSHYNWAFHLHIPLGQQPLSMRTSNTTSQTQSVCKHLAYLKHMSFIINP